MAQVNVQWPSEDEEFDATINKSAANAAPKEETDQSVQPAITETKPSEAAVEESASQTADASPESEPAHEETEAHNEPMPAHVPASAAPKTGNKLAILRTVGEVLLVLIIVGLAMRVSSLSNDNTDLKKQVSTLNNNPQIVIQRQTDALIKRVGQLIQLPSDETPTVANVSDAEKAKQQSAFFNNAQNGDKVLMYVKAGQAILYRPSTDKIVLVAPLTFSNPATPAPATTKTTR
jgi:hypothetical protein